MNAKFKKLATQVGVAAVLAAGSLSAHAVITAVPAPAQLIPLFFHDDVQGLDVEARVIVPRAVGVDTVIQLLGGKSQSSYLPPSVQPGLTVPANATSRIHWIFLNVRSEEVVNSSFPVTPDDEVYFSAANMPCAESGLVNGNNVCTVQPTIPNAEPGYLVMINESAVTGNADPLFTFSAEAWLANESTAANGLPTAAVIPVLGMADTADTTDYPTPTNNVIESGIDIIASPIHTGMRTSTTLANMNVRVFDIPMQPTTGGANGANDNYLNTIVAWADRNYAAAVANPPAAEIKNGLSGALWTFNTSEVGISNGKLTLPNQLNIVPVWAGNPPANYPFRNIYTTKDGNVNGGVGLGGGALTNVTFANLNRGGFLKFAVDAVALPNGGNNLAPGAYSSVVIFTLPQQVYSATGTSGFADDDAELAIDTGFFTDK